MSPVSWGSKGVYIVVIVTAALLAGAVWLFGGTFWIDGTSSDDRIGEPELSISHTQQLLDELRASRSYIMPEGTKASILAKVSGSEGISDEEKIELLKRVTEQQ